MTRYLSLIEKSKRRSFWLLVTAVALLSSAKVNLASVSSIQDLADQAPRIIGGTDSTVEEWPSVVFIYIPIDNGYVMCGGNLIAPNWVLTAAHCLVDDFGNHRHAAGMVVVLGTTDLTGEMHERREVTNVIVHPDYNYLDVAEGSDIALLELAIQSEQPTMALYSGKPDVGADATVIGWGVTGYDAQGNSQTAVNNLQEVAIPIVSNEVCNRPESYNGAIIDSQLCAGFAEGGKDSCQGDSGGPLMALQDGKYKQVGIVSFGDGCALPNKYGVYTRISSFRVWIEEFTGSLVDSEPNLY